MKYVKKEFKWNDEESQRVFASDTSQFINDIRFKNEVENLILSFDLKRHEKILDYGCGNGVHVRELIKRNYTVTGYDPSKFYIEQAKEITSQNRLNADFYSSEKEFLKNKYDFIYTINYPVSYFSENELQNTFETIYKILNTSGRFLFGFTFTREDREKALPRNSWKEENGIFQLTDEKMDENGLRVERYIVINTKSEEITEWIDVCRYYNLNEIIQIINKSGFKVKGCYENLKKDQANEITCRYILCEK